MRARSIVLPVLALALAGAAAYGLYRLGMSRGIEMANRGHPASGKKVLYWQDPMAPGQKFDRPGKSPFMDMPLVPVYENDAGGTGGVAVDPRMQQSLGIRTAQVTRGTLTPVVEAVGTVAYNERDVAVVQARANGFVEKLHVRAPLEAVKKGQPLAELYVPDWVAAQEEYLSARRLAGTSLEGLIDGARQRMRLAGMSDEQIASIENTGRVHPRLVVYAPLEGVVAELSAREGMTVMAGAPLYRINGLRTVWINAEVRESDARGVRVGNGVEARAAALPDRVYKGTVSAILPEVNPATRTLKARVEIANPRTELKPGMFARVNFTPTRRPEVLVVPSEAVIQTGQRSVVVIVQDDGRFAPVEVQIGREADGKTEIRAGLEAGRKVVVSGQFLIDSEASLRASEKRMEGPAQKSASYPGTGKILSVSAPSGYVELAHDPIAGLKWPAMTMGFQVDDKSQLLGLAEGDRVQFELYGLPNQEGEFVLKSIRKAGDR